MKTPEIIYEDNDIIVVYKPAGMATQTKKLGQQDMESYLKNYRAKKKEPPYIGVVHRLDQPVEGVMVFAKSQKAAANLSKQVQDRIIGKHYKAACVFAGDEVAKLEIGDSGTLTDYMLTDKKANVSKIVPEGTPQAKKAVLDYKVEKIEEGIIWFDITLHTGRQHQIRLQLSNIGYPIVGDKKYGGTKDIVNSSKKLMLCSYKIEFRHPSTRGDMDFEKMELPIPLEEEINGHKQ